MKKRMSGSHSVGHSENWVVKKTEPLSNTSGSKTLRT